MSAMDEEEIVDLIKNKEYSRVAFLKEERLLQENECYYGFLYFLADSQREDTTDILVKIERKLGNRAKAYKYLGEVADKMYPNFDVSHIAESFFRKSVGLDESDSEAWWGLFCKTNDCHAFLESLKLDYTNKSYVTINNKLSNTPVCYINSDDFTTNDWSELEEIISDQNVSGKEKKTGQALLISAYYHLNRHEDGVDLIHSADKLTVDIVRKYYQSGVVDVDLALSKLHCLDFPKFLGDDHERIYKEYCNESLKGNANPTKFALIETAFRAKKYQDVIDLYSAATGSDKALFSNYLEDHIYFALASYYLGAEVDTNLFDYINNNWQEGFNDSHRGLRQALKLKRIIYKLNKQLNNKTYNGYPISFSRDYPEAKRLLEDLDLLKHYLYDELDKELEAISELWDTNYLNCKYSKKLGEQENPDFSYDDIMRFSDKGIGDKRYDEVIDEVMRYHIKNKPKIMTCYILGICFERKGSNDDAFEQYAMAIEIMDRNKDFNFTVIGSYLRCANKSSVVLSKAKYQEYRDKLNISLVEMYKWDVLAGKGSGHLFKYYPFNINTLDSLVNQYFYLPSKEQLNDPIELPKLDDIGSGCFIDSDYKICSFSNNKNSMLMWSHYTQNHQGIMVEYKFGGELPSGAGIGKVKYTNEIKRNKEKNEYVFNQFLLTKNHEWAYEEEVRLLSYKKDKLYYENYDYPEHDRSKINAQIVSITLGCQFDESKKPLIINLIKNANEQRKSHEPIISLRQAKISESNVFKLDYVNIEL